MHQAQLAAYVTLSLLVWIAAIAAIVRYTGPALPQADTGSALPDITSKITLSLDAAPPGALLEAVDRGSKFLQTQKAAQLKPSHNNQVSLAAAS